MTDPRVPITKSFGLELLPKETREFARRAYETASDPRVKHRLVRDLLLGQFYHRGVPGTPSRHQTTQYGGKLMIGRVLDNVGIPNPDFYPVDILEEMREHPQIALAVGIVKGIIKGLDWSIECKDRSQRMFLEQAIDSIYDPLIDSLCEALDFGYSSNELVWDLRDVEIADLEDSSNPDVSPRRKVYYKRTSFLISKIIDHHPSAVRVLLHQDTQEMLGVTIQNPLTGQYAVLKNGWKLLFFGFDQNNGNVFGRSRLIPCYKSWYWSEIMMHFMARWSERRANPQLLLHHPVGMRMKKDGTMQDAADFATELGMALLDHAMAVMPSEFDANGRNDQWRAELLSDDPTRGSMWVEILNHLDTKMIRGYCVPDRAITQSLATGGTSEGTQSSRDLMLITVAYPIRRLQRVINDEILRPLQQTNFPSNKRVMARFKYQRPEFDRRALLKEILVEWIRQWPNYLKNGKFPNKAVGFEEAAKILDVPIVEASAIFDDAVDGAAEEVGGQGADQIRAVASGNKPDAPPATVPDAKPDAPLPQEPAAKRPRAAARKKIQG